MFVDTAKIRVTAGAGGDGKVSFHREKYVASGGPDGGDGGKGGNIVLQTDSNLSTLADFRYRRAYKADSGKPGEAGRRSGRSADDLIIRVPVGTLVREAESGAVMADMSDGEPVVIARGGRGGWGNTHFASAVRQAPRFAKSGAQGESWEITLELKLLADVGLLGFPNVGKSSLLATVSQAKPVVADYHFTTLSPVLGVVRIAEGTSFVMADIPGLIEGASDGTGLGHAFLRHVERCRMLIHVLDAAGTEGRDPLEDFEKINAELAAFQPELARLPQIVALNKIDCATQEQLQRVQDYCTAQTLPFYEICAPIGMGTKELMQATAALLATLPPVKIYAPEPLPLKEERAGQFTVTVEDGEYYVEAEWLARVLARVDMDDFESLQYFQRVLQTSGVMDELFAAGLQEGDTVCVAGLVFEYIP
ncbi:MAG: GTPase ObgE [Oscillospiraceae bacterium]|jgi:GTP-binding protein|nr:GTPase ObgE [Oscillospiraceae bacterium]